MHDGKQGCFYPPCEVDLRRPSTRPTLQKKLTSEKRCSGASVSRRVASVITPRVPSWPMNRSMSFPESRYPAAVLTGGAIHWHLGHWGGMGFSRSISSPPHWEERPQWPQSSLGWDRIESSWLRRRCMRWPRQWCTRIERWDREGSSSHWLPVGPEKPPKSDRPEHALGDRESTEPGPFFRWKESSRQKAPVLLWWRCAGR